MNQLSVRPRPDQEATCPLCRDVLEQAQTATCEGCQTAYHGECMAELGGCATLGCERLGQELREAAAQISSSDPNAWEESLERWRRAHDPVESWIGDRRKGEARVRGPQPMPSSAGRAQEAPVSWTVRSRRSSFPSPDITDWPLRLCGAVYAVSGGALCYRGWSRGDFFFGVFGGDTRLWLGVAGACLVSYCFLAYLACLRAGFEFKDPYSARSRPFLDTSQARESLGALCLFIILAVPGAPLVYWLLAELNARRAAADRRAGRPGESA